MAMLLLLGSAVVATAAIGLKKPYTADISPHSVTTGSTVTFTATITNKTSSQSLGSCNITAPSGFTLVSTNQPTSQGTATIAGDVLQLRNLNTAPMTSRTVSYDSSVPAAAGTYSWGIECRQSNAFNPDTMSNQFGLDAANSNLKTTVSAPPPPPPPSADLAVTGNSDSPDPVVGANTVEYTVTVHNNGPATSGPVTLTDSLPSGGSITSVSAPAAWTCSGSGTSRTCTHAALANGADAEAVVIRVLAPNSNTTIVNRAAVSQSGATDSNAANNTSDQSTTVNKDSTCTSGFVSCGTGRVIYNLLSQVTTGSTPTAARFVVGTTTFQATAASGSQNWSMSAPAVPGSFCPVDLTDTAVTQCNWQMNLDIIPSPYTTPGLVTFVGVCHASRCPVGLIPGAGTIVVMVGDDGSHQILPGCNGSGDTRKCFEQARVPLSNDLKITVRNLVAGDPRIAGICAGGC